MTKPNLDMEAAIKQLFEGKNLTGKDGIQPSLIKQLTGAAMQLNSMNTKQQKNSQIVKMVKSPDGSSELNTTRDRAETFEPQLISKRRI